MKTIEQINKDMYTYLAKNHGCTEFDKTINNLSRSIIQTMAYVHKDVWLYTVNLYKDKQICEKYVGQKITNFYCTAVVPVKDQELIDMIEKWNGRKPVSSSANRLDFVNSIFNKLEELGGQVLLWA